MQLSFSTAFILAAFTAVLTPVAAQSCFEATRFGVVSVTPSTLSPGDVSRLHQLFWLLLSLTMLHPPRPSL
jgi:hypothetical protein